MNVAYLTTDDPLYLPAFFERVLSQRSDPATVYVVPPLYRNQTPLDAAWRYFRTFGLRAAWGLVLRVAGAKLRRRSIASVCAQHGIRCDPVSNVNDAEFLERLRSERTDLIVSVSCPQIFKKPLIELAPRGCLNVHGAILPAYRGVMPSFWMLANGERQAGVSIFFVNEQIDAGELAGQRIFDIPENDTLDSFLHRSKSVGAELLVDVLDGIERGTIARTPLDLSAGSYYSWPDRGAVEAFYAAGRQVW